MSDQVIYDYSKKIRTIQSAIKTQNDVLINKINTMINQATLDAFEKLEDNLKIFISTYQSIMNSPAKQPDSRRVVDLQMTWIDEQIKIYQDHNLKNIYQSLSSSISNLQNGENNEQTQSSLLEVLQLLVRASELYSKNLKELLNFRLPPDPFSMVQALTAQFQGKHVSIDDRICRISSGGEVQPTLNLSRKVKLGTNTVYDIHPIKNSDHFLVTTFENDLLIYDYKTETIIRQMEPLRFAPASSLFLHGFDGPNAFLDKDTILKKKDLIIFGGSEFDPNVYIYNYQTGRRIQTLPGHDRSIRYLAQLGDVTTLVTAGRDTRVFFWNLMRGEPIQIQQIPTMEIIDLQLNAEKNQIFCLSIDGKIIVLKLTYKTLETSTQIKQEIFQKAEIVSLIELNETSSLSQILWLNQKLVIVSFSSGWLTGQNMIKVIEEKENQTSIKLNKDFQFLLEREIYQLNSVIVANNQLLVFAVRKDDGLIQGFVYPNNKEIVVIGQEPNILQEGEDQIRWNIKLLYENGNCKLLKYGKEDRFEIYDLAFV